tara:strand:- start:3890 stop:4597 length:708 start_codon:yes stop_codon:yes gene_type:complete
MKLQVVISCEHASNEVPEAYRSLFVQAESDLNSHRGWDPGSYDIAEHLGKHLESDPFVYPYTRLLVEPNRSLDNEQLFSEFSKLLSRKEKIQLVNTYYKPYRELVESQIRELTGKGPVLHLGIHTFTPDWNGTRRDVDIGILFDPGRDYEQQYAHLLVDQLSGNGFVVKENEPYLGISDGFTTYLRTRFEDTQYMGFEIEVSQGLLGRLSEVSALLSQAISKVNLSFQGRIAYSE